MRAAKLVSKLLIEVRPTDTVDLALRIADDNKLEHLPLVDNDHLVGVITEDDLFNVDATLTIEQANVPVKLVEVQEDMHYFEAIKLFGVTQLSVLPVKGVDGYLGSITKDTILEAIEQTSGVQTAGATVILEMNPRDYSLVQIAQIVEGNDARILATQIQAYPERDKIDVTLKLNTANIGGLLQTFARYNYFIKATYQENNVDDIIQKRYDELMNYINM